MHKTVVVTGSQGRIGRSLVPFLREQAFDVRVIDNRLSAQNESHDLSEYDGEWQAVFKGADTVVHLAAQSYPGAAWSELIGPNMDAILNVYLAATAHGVKKVILASSIWVLGGHRFSNQLMQTDTPPNPGANAYAATKLFAERTARAFYASHGISTYVFRIGAYAPETMNRHSSDWIQSAWLADDDMRAAMKAALDCSKAGVFALNLVSDISPARWETEPLNALLACPPRQKRHVGLSVRARLKAFLFYVGRFAVPSLGRRVPWHW